MEKLGRYQIREIIGEGAMARVYKGYDPEIDREIAIKLLKSQLAEDDQYRMRFLREAKGAGTLSHPNIVTIFDVGVDGKHPYIAMELVDGLTLTDLIRTGQATSMRDVVEIGIQLTRALDYAHKKGIIHRDIKPGNIMLVSSGNQVKVTDFGICRIDGSDQELTQHTQLGDVLGTPNYMSPEQVLGQKVDSRSDLFSVGVVLYKLVTGALPFEGDSIISVAMKITQTDPPTVEKLRPDVPLSLRRVIERSLKKQPEKRYQTGEEFAQALIGVARELKEAEEKKGKGKGLSLSVRWAAIMAGIVVVTMSLTATILYQRQYAAMLDQVKGYGGSLAKVMATQSAVPLLAEDFAAIDVFVQETLARQDFPYLVVTDDEGVVRGSNDPKQVGQRYAAPVATLVGSPDAEVEVRTHELASGNVLDFTSPILFQKKPIGAVHLGIYEAPLARVANLVYVLLAILTLVTVAAVAAGTFLLARRIAAPIRVLRARWTRSRMAATTCASARRARMNSASSTRPSTRPPRPWKRDTSLPRRSLMRPLPRASPPRQRRADDMLRALAIATLTVLLAACAETPQRPEPPPAPVVYAPADSGPMLARDASFIVVVPRAGEDFGALAERWLGDRSRRFEIAEFNRQDEARAGRPVALPVKPLNPGGVERASVQTVPIITYHRFGAKPSTMTVTPSSFEAQMRYLAQNGYTVIPMSRLADFLEGRIALPRKSVVITIDDGYRSTYDIAWPILKKHGFPATVFLYTDFVGASDALTWAQMKEMSASGLIDIQPHSKTHSNLTMKLADENDARYRERIRREIETPVDTIRERLGEPTVTYAFPYGDVNETVVEYLRGKGVKLGVTVTPGGNAFFAPPPMLRRTMVYGADDLDAFRGKLVTALPVARP
ncbi:MAG: protein kinase [Betaproteobacteria bacterium]|nr:protein kinase [Betaproteobacteria bacterium]